MQFASASARESTGAPVALWEDPHAASANAELTAATVDSALISGQHGEERVTTP
jgi:hypothetical protein